MKKRKLSRAQRATERFIKRMAKKHGVPEDMVRGMVQWATDSILELLEIGPISNPRLRVTVLVDQLGPLSRLNWGKLEDETTVVGRLIEWGHPLIHPDARQGEQTVQA